MKELELIPEKIKKILKKKILLDSANEASTLDEALQALGKHLNVS